MALPLSLTDTKVELLAEQRRAHKKIYRDRKMNMFKKAEELSILCGTDVAVILYHPADESSTVAQPALETWPKNPTDIKRIIRRYKAKTSSTLASFPSTSPLEIEDRSTTSTSSSSSASPNMREKRKYINLELSLSLSYNSKRIWREDKSNKKLRADDDENIISDETMGIQNKFQARWNASGKGIIYKDHDKLRIALLESKREAITKRIASLQATYV